MARKESAILLVILLALSLMCIGCSSSSAKHAVTHDQAYSKASTYNVEKQRLDQHSAWFDSLGSNVMLAAQGISIPD